MFLVVDLCLMHGVLAVVLQIPGDDVGFLNLDVFVAFDYQDLSDVCTAGAMKPINCIFFSAIKMLSCIS